MNTAEKRAAMEAAGESWPDCECHGEAMSWNRKASIPQGGWFRCRVKHAQTRRNRRAYLASLGVCIHCAGEHCAGELATETMCRSCADRHADIMAQPKQQIDNILAKMRLRRRQRAAEGFRPTGVLTSKEERPGPLQGEG